MILEWYEESLDNQDVPVSYRAYCKGLRFSDCKPREEKGLGLSHLRVEAVAKSLEQSLGQCTRRNEYEIRAEHDGSFWIYHRALNSGEPLRQWIESALYSCGAGD